MTDFLSFLPTLESALALSLLEAAWWGALLGLAGLVVLAAMARRSAAARHAVGLGFLVAMVVAPAWHCVALVAGGDTIVAHVSSAHAQALAGGPAAAAVAAASLPNDWLVGLWAIGVLVMLLRLAGGFWLLRLLARVPAAPLPPAWQARADLMRRVLGIARPVAVRVIDSIAQPFAARVLRPVVWLPTALLTRLAPAQLEALIAHELAHIRRLDWLWNGLQCGIEALLFFHPAVWMLGRRVRQERENACDDLAAMLCGGDPLVVAEALAALATLAAQRPLPRLALAAGGGALVQRVARLVGAQPASGLRWSTAAAVAAILVAGGLLGARASVAAQPAPASAAAAADLPTDPWWTNVGDSIRLRFSEDGHLREYHAWRDLLGERHETFRVDGQPQPIDDGVRRWLAAHHPVAPPPPVPPVPDVSAVPDVPPVPDVSPVPDVPPVPDTPPPPVLTALPAYKALVAQLAADPQAAARLGSPIEVEDDCGPCRIDDDHVSLTLTARGPKGALRLYARGRRIDGAWHYDELRLDRGASLSELFGAAR